jgi:ribulose 1,5-bisphosphate synthetase/thiazole synthase
MKKVEADVVVIAAGPSGLAAAVTAAEGGAGVIKSPLDTRQLAGGRKAGSPKAKRYFSVNDE